MFLKSINIQNFRNYKLQSLQFEKPITLLIGDNAQGKTNFLEAIYYLATAKSSRAERDDELIGEDNDFLKIEGDLKGDNRIEITLQNTNSFLKKRVLVNGISRRVADYSENLVVIFFAPEDVNLVTGSPSLRRSHIDQFLSQVDRDYKRALSNYESIITRKNKVLKMVQEGISKIGELDFWIDQQILFGTLLQTKRQGLFDFLNLNGKNFANFEFKYLQNELSLERLKEYLQKEIITASSLIGPHRDDFDFLLDSKNLANFGSRGQQRTAVLDLKLLQISYVEKVLNTRPVMLLDDIFSELDLEHKKYVLEVASKQQTIISAIEIHDLKQEIEDMDGVNLLKVENGEIKAF